MIDKSFKNKISRQNYLPKQQIEGVKLIDLKCFHDDTGDFLELGRLSKVGALKGVLPGFKLKQINWSQVLPGAIKAGHLHKKQDDIWFVPPGDRLLVGLLDVRAKSKSKGVKMRLILGPSQAQLLFIPAGLIHGCANPFSRTITLIYLVNQHWTGADEYRIDYKIFGQKFWQMQVG